MIKLMIQKTSTLRNRQIVLIALGMLTNSVIPCYAASCSLSVDVTLSKVYGKFVYDEPGHQLKLVVQYKEIELATAVLYENEISKVKNGNETTVTASRNSASGCLYTWAQSTGYVDNVLYAVSPEMTV